MVFSRNSFTESPSHVQAIGTGAIGDTAADTATAHGRGFGLKILRPRTVDSLGLRYGDGDLVLDPK